MTKRQLQLAIEAGRAGQSRGRFSVELKREVGAYCAERRAAGAAWSELVADLALSENQLRQWSGASGTRRVPKLRRVQVIAGVTASAATGLRLELPGGGQVVGLGVADVAALLRALR